MYFNKIKIKSVCHSLIFTILLLGVSLLLMLFYYKDVKQGIFHQYTDITGLSSEELEAYEYDFVTLKITEHEGCLNYCSTSTNEEDTQWKMSEEERAEFINADTTRYLYKLPGKDYSRYMVLALNPDEMIRMNQIFADELDSFSVTGRLKEVNKPCQDVQMTFLNSYRKTFGKDYNRDQVWMSYELIEGSPDYNYYIYEVLLFGLGVVLALWGVIRLVKAFCGIYTRKFFKDIEKSGYTDVVVYEDYLNAESFGRIKIGKLFAFVDIGATSPRAAKLEDVFWAYPCVSFFMTVPGFHHIVSRRDQFIEVKETNMLRLHSLSQGVIVSKKASKNDVFQAILYLQNHYPFIANGWNRENYDAYRAGEEALLKKAYHKYAHEYLETSES